MKLKPFVVFGAIGFVFGMGTSLFDPNVFMRSQGNGVFLGYSGMEVFLNIARYGMLGLLIALIFVLAYQLSAREKTA